MSEEKHLVDLKNIDLPTNTPKVYEGYLPYVDVLEKKIVQLEEENKKLNNKQTENKKTKTAAEKDSGFSYFFLVSFCINIHDANAEYCNSQKKKAKTSPKTHRVLVKIMSK